MSHNITIKRQNKSYDNRKLVITIDKKKYYAKPWWGWFSIDTGNLEIRPIIREIVMNNLYWLVGRDCDIETWAKYISDCDSGKKLYNTPLNTTPASMFFNTEEKERAYNSFGK